MYEQANPGENIYICINEDASLNFGEFLGEVKLVSKNTFLKHYLDYESVIIHSLTQNNLWACSFLKYH